MTNFRYEDMDRRGKTNKSPFPYRESKERRMVYLWGYSDGATPPILSISSYMNTFEISRRTAREDLKKYPQIIVVK